MSVSVGGTQAPVGLKAPQVMPVGSRDCAPLLRHRSNTASSMSPSLSRPAYHVSPTPPVETTIKALACASPPSSAS